MVLHAPGTADSRKPRPPQDTWNHYKYYSAEDERTAGIEAKQRAVDFDERSQQIDAPDQLDDTGLTPDAELQLHLERTTEKYHGYQTLRALLEVELLEDPAINPYDMDPDEFFGEERLQLGTTEGFHIIDTRPETPFQEQPWGTTPQELLPTHEDGSPYPDPTHELEELTPDETYRLERQLGRTFRKPRN